jgi:F-type H+-transporting ATPase subunit delta
MPAGSTQSQALLVEAVDDALEAGADATVVGDELFALVGILDAQPALRRVLTEPSVPAEAKARLMASLLADKVSEATEKIVDAAVGMRWSHGSDLADGLERAGAACHIIKAEQDGDLDSLEDELFRFSRILVGARGLRDTLGNRRAPIEAKRELVDNLLDGKVTTSTMALVRQAVSGRGGPLPIVLRRFQELAAARRERLVALVRVAAALTDDQAERLAEALGDQYGKRVHLNVIVEPDVLGGVRVQIGDEVIDSTVATRLAEARRRLAG